MSKLTNAQKTLIAYISDKNPKDITFSDYLELSEKLKVVEPMINSSEQNKKLGELK